MGEEEVLHAYRLRIDYVAITSRRLLVWDRGSSDEKPVIVSIPLIKIHSAGISRESFLHWPVEVEIYTGRKDYELVFENRSEAVEFYQALCNLICR
jgi:Bacterial PH domain